MVRRSTTLHALLLSTLALGTPAATFAQAAAPQAAPQPAAAPAAPQAATPAPEPADAADALFRKGNDAFRAKKWEEAIGLYQKALAMKKAHDIAANLAYAELKVGRTAEAAAHLAFAVRTWPPTGKADNRRIAAEHLEKAKKDLATLSVQVSVPWAEVSINGKPVGTSPLEDPVFAAPGMITIEAKRSGYTPAKQVMQVEKGSEQSVTLSLVASADERGPAVSSITPAVGTDKPGTPAMVEAKSGASSDGSAAPAAGKPMGEATTASRYKLPSSSRVLRRARFSSVPGSGSRSRRSRRETTRTQFLRS